MDFMKGWKTLLFNIIAIAAIVGKHFYPEYWFFQVLAIIDETTLIAIISGINIMLRFLTKTRIFNLK